jgi:hypothetical protein
MEEMGVERAPGSRERGTFLAAGQEAEDQIYEVCQSHHNVDFSCPSPIIIDSSFSSLESLSANPLNTSLLHWAKWGFR